MLVKHYRTEDVGRKVVFIHIVDQTRCWFPEKSRHYCNHCNGTMLPRVQYTLEHIQKHKITNHPAVPTLEKLLREWNEQLKSIGLFHKYHLWYWWSDPQDDACQGRVLSKSRQQMVWTVMHVALRLETTSTSPYFADVLPSEMWMLILTFVKHSGFR